MNQREFDKDLYLDNKEWTNPEDGYGWSNNPIAKLFDSNTRARFHRGLPDNFERIDGNAVKDNL